MYLSDDTWELVSRKVAVAASRCAVEAAAMEELYQDTLAAFIAAGNNNTSLARVLYQLPYTPKLRLRVDATLQTIYVADAAGNKLTGTGAFNLFTIGQKVKSTGFAVSANNNFAMIVTGKPDPDTMKFNDQAGLVTETGSGDERLLQQPTSDQEDAVGDLMATLLAGHELYGALTGEITTTVDRLALFRNFK